MPGNYSKLVTVITGQTITAAERNNEFDNVINNMTTDGVDDASATLTAMQATVDPSGGSLSTTLRGELQRLRFQLLKAGAASGNWYDAFPWLSAITPATPGATATDLNNRLAQLISYLNSTTGTTWPTLPVKTMLQYLALTGGTMSGDIAMGTSKVTGLGAAVSNGQAVRYEQLPGIAGTITNWAALPGVTVTGFGTIANTTWLSRRVGDSLQVRGNFTIGTATAVAMKINLPTVTLDTAKLATNINSCVGVLYNLTNALQTLYSTAGAYALFTDQTDSATVYVSNQTSGNGFVKSLGTTLANSTNCSLFFEIPISGYTI